MNSDFQLEGRSMRGGMAAAGLLICGLLADSRITAADRVAADTYLVGIVVRDITPAYPIRLSGFGFRRTESEGVAAPIFARTLAIGSDADGPAVLIAVDSTGIPRAVTAEVAKRLATVGVKPERFAITATHTHTAPMLAGVLPTLFGKPVTDEQQARIAKYTAELTDHLEAAALAALKAREPSQLWYGIGEAGLAKNRRSPPGGPVDHDLPVLVVKSPAGQIRALWATYACHAVTLSHNFIGGDWPGFTVEALERQRPGVVALFSIGCGADQNPLTGVTGDKIDVARQQGAEMAAAVEKAIAGAMRPVSGPLTATAMTIELPLAELPSRAHWESLVSKGSYIGYHAKVQLATLDRGEALPTKIPYQIQSWSFGDSLGLVFLPGEVVVDYALRLKREFDRQRLWICAYSNDCPCYIPSERVLREGGYEGGAAMTYYNLPAKLAEGIEGRIVDEVQRQVPASLKSPLQANAGPKLPLTPPQSLARMQIPTDLRVELVAAEPLTADPIAIDFGPDGALWVCEMHDYPAGRAGNYEAGGRVRVLRDDDGDGQYDRSTIFLDGLPFPTGVTAWRNGVLICAAPDILFAADTDGDDRADVRRPLFTGFGTENYQARVNSLTYGLDGWVYGACGLFGGDILLHLTKQTVALGNRDFRIDPDRGALEPLTGRTQQGRVRNDEGDWFGCNNSQPFMHYPLLDDRSVPGLPVPATTVFIASTGDPLQLYPRLAEYQRFKLTGPAGRVTAACGIGVYRDDWLGDSLRGQAFVCEPVNLVVHRRVLEPQGVTFTGRRAPEEAMSEFLTSTDNWFRPAQVRTGPDGGLWIVDMSRAVIEHPRWIPEDVKSQLDVRAGDQLGRIYRLLPRDRGARPVPRLDQMSGAELVEQLRSPNGVVRDLAQQLLLWRDDRTVISQLTALAASSSDLPTTRVAALWILARWHQLDLSWWNTALSDASPVVRRHAAQILVVYRDQFSESAKLVARLADETDPQVLLVSTDILQQDASPAATDLLARWTLRHGQDAYLRFALLRAVPASEWGRFVQRVLAEPQAPTVVVTAIAGVTLASQDAMAWQKLYDRIVPDSPVQPPSSWSQAEQLALAQQRQPKVFAKMLGNERLTQWGAWLEQVRRTFDAADTADEQRQRLAGLLSASTDADRLLARLSPLSPPALQMRLVQVLLRADQPALLQQLLGRWNVLTPAVRPEVLDHLLSRPTRTGLLLDALETGTISANGLDAQRRQALLAHRNADIAARATKLFGALSTARSQVIEQHRSVLALSGDIERGRGLFQRRCAVCHALNGQGFAVGPDLGESKNKAWSALLQALLDPNQAVDQRYATYLANLQDGRSVQGLLAEETATAITLKGQEAKLSTIERRDIDELVSSGRSLMPEGLEKDLSPQDFADLCALITQRPMAEADTAPDVTTIAGQILDDARPRPDREALIAQYASQSANLIAAMAGGLGSDAKEEYRRIPWIWRVAVAAGKRNNADELRSILRVALPAVEGPLTDWQAVVIGGGVINGITQAGAWPHERVRELIGNDRNLQQRWRRCLDDAVAMSDREATPPGTRYDALRIIPLDGWAKRGPQLLRYLAVDAHAELQMGAVSGTADVPETAAAQALLEHFTGLKPRNQALALDGLMRSEERMLLLLDAVATEKLPAAALDETRRKALKTSTSMRVRERASQLWP